MIQVKADELLIKGWSEIKGLVHSFPTAFSSDGLALQGEWRVATNRTVDASDAKIHMSSSERTYRDVFNETWPEFPAGLHPDYTYMFEL